MALLLLLAGLLSCAGLGSRELDEHRGWTLAHDNLHQVDGPKPGPGQPARGFRVYRSGAPSRKTFALWCETYGIERVIVLSGDAEHRELEYQTAGICPDIEVLYDVEQSHAEPVSDGFLELFDREVERARDDGVGLLFRCRTGSHRAGRTAAYYQMKYQGVDVDEAIRIMTRKGVAMWALNPKLVPQVRAMDEYIRGRPCTQPEQYCVEVGSSKWVR
jgi:protein-tyrosine phosphatase